MHTKKSIYFLLKLSTKVEKQNHTTSSTVEKNLISRLPTSMLPKHSYLQLAQGKPSFIPAEWS